MYLLENDLSPDLQSAYRTNHSTETAVLKVLSDILLALDSGKLALLSLLDLSAAFECRSRHAVAKTTDALRSVRERYRLVRLLSYWTYTVRTDCGVPVDIVSSVIWSAAGFGPRTNPVPPLRC